MRTLVIILITLFSMQSLKGQHQIDIDDKTLDIEDVIYDGIDVSSYQKDIDWSATAKDKNIKFVYVKATEGATYRSRHYEGNIANARQHGIRVGSYHFFRTTVSVESQFRNFTSTVKKEDQDLIPLIDVETKRGVTAAQLADSVLAFANMIEDYYTPAVHSTTPICMGASVATLCLLLATPRCNLDLQGGKNGFCGNSQSVDASMASTTMSTCADLTRVVDSTTFSSRDVAPNA